MKILLTVDGSKHSNWAVNLLLGLPLKDEPYITLFHVVNLPTHRVPLIPNLPDRKEFIRELRQEKLAAAKRFVESLENKLMDKFGNVSSVFAESGVAKGIIERSKRESSDLIVVGSRGLSDISTLLLGGVSQRVITYSPCSVLVVKRRVRNFRRILIAVDGSAYSDTLVKFIKSTFRGEGIEVKLLYVRNLPFDMSGDTLFMNRYCRELQRAGFKIHTVCEKGDPAWVIINEAKAQKSHLVVIGSRGMSGLKMFLLGRTARKVVTYGATSVLLLRGA